MKNDHRKRSIALLAVASLALLACTGADRQEMGGQREMMSGGMMSGGMMAGGMMGGQMQDMGTIHGLLASHDRISRTVEDLPNGVRTVTTSDDPRVAELIRTHVRQMRDRYEGDRPIRAMDPLFRELFERRDEARLEFRDVPGGIEVVHTSSDPQVVRLIRQHAHHFVDGVVERGMAASMGPTPLPEGYGRRQ